MDELTRFRDAFNALTSDPPFPWQENLYMEWFSQGKIPLSCNLPTGLGKTSVIAIWLIALANWPEKTLRRLVYVVNRRTVVDQTTEEVLKYRQRLAELEENDPLRRSLGSLAISTLRGQFADNREWSADPSRPAVIVGTVDMIGSRLLFSGYGVGFKAKPLHAGFLAQDVLLVHDEAHLEPAFQKLLVAIREEQDRCNEFRKFRVMELSATSRGQEPPFELTKLEKDIPTILPKRPTEPVHFVWRRQKAKKALSLHPLKDEKQLADEIVNVKHALKYKDSKQAVLIFVRKVEDADKIVKKLPKGCTQQLTGTLRGLERNRMADPRNKYGCPIFARFLKPPKPDADANEQWKIEPQPGTVYLVCTSAGEVGANLSANHLVCDLSTFDSMAQRFGRVNRFGDYGDTEIHVVHPVNFEDEDALDDRREKTLALLRQLNGDASPSALANADAGARLAAFAPEPTILPVTDILFDAWALTTISPPLVRTPLPGRPPVERYLHGISDWQPPETRVAWREEVGVITGDLLQRYKPEALLDDCPLKPHELLRDSTDRKSSGVFAHLEKLSANYPYAPVWVLDTRGQVRPTTLKHVISGGKEAIHEVTVILPPSVGGLSSTGTLDGGAKPDDTVKYDVADMWFSDKEETVKRRIRVWDNDPQFDEKTRGMRLVLAPLDTRPDADENESEPAGHRYWHWYTKPRSADDDLSKTYTTPIKWQHHTEDVTERTREIIKTLNLPGELPNAMLLAAKFHDLGKRRDVWQRSIGNPNPSDWYAKSGKAWKPCDICPDYRHEFGSLLDVEDEPEFIKLNEDMKNLVLHLIAAHHGRGRPHFPLDEILEPEPQGKGVAKIASNVPQRFARLQRKYGRWGLAYLESLLRAADYAASANPSEAIPKQLEVKT